MADTKLRLRSGTGETVDIALVDNGDGTYSVAVSGDGLGGGDGDGLTDAELRASPVVVTSQAGVTLTNISGSLTAGGTAQNAAGANSSRRGFFIQNIHASSSLWISTLATAVADQPSIEIKPGALYESPPGGCGGGAISVIGATTGQKWVGREW